MQLRVDVGGGVMTGGWFDGDLLSELGAGVAMVDYCLLLMWWQSNSRFAIMGVWVFVN